MSTLVGLSVAWVACAVLFSAVVAVSAFRERRRVLRTEASEAETRVIVLPLPRPPLLTISSGLRVPPALTPAQLKVRARARQGDRP